MLGFDNFSQSFLGTGQFLPLTIKCYEDWMYQTICKSVLSIEYLEMKL